MSTPAWEYVFTPSAGAALTLNANTRSRETGAAARLGFYTYCQVDGRDAIKLGEDGRALALTAWLHAADEAALRTAMEACSTAARNATVGTLSIRGASVTWSNVIIVGPPQFDEHYKALDDGSVGVLVSLAFEQLVP